MASTRHHFVPQGYLRGFTIADDQTRNFVYVYDKRDGRAPRRKSVRSIAWAHAYYAQEKEDGTEDLESIEERLARSIDNDVPDIIRALNPVPNVVMELSQEDKGKLAFFIGISLTRVPSFRDGINDFHSEIANSMLQSVIRDRPELENFELADNVVAEVKPWVSLRAMVEVASAISKSSLDKNWQFMIAPPEVPLVTSDNPVLFSSGPSKLMNIGPAHPGAELVMNLRSDLALVCTPVRGYPDQVVFNLKPPDARKFNRGIVKAARHRIFANHYSEKFDSFVKKYRNFEQKVVV